MALDFVNRTSEIGRLDEAWRKGGLVVVYGRRRVGKTRLLRRWLASHEGFYSQAIEAESSLQVEQVYRDIREHLDTRVVPKDWTELLDLLRLKKGKWAFVLDELPYLVASDPSLPSRLQRWIDHDLPDGCLLVLAGSSTRMMNDIFLNRQAPLYGRAWRLMPIAPMSYHSFCEACSLPVAEMDSFEKFSCVGGIPKYWEYVEQGKDTISLCESLYFAESAFMQEEPQRSLRDEGVGGVKALSVLEAVGRGESKPSGIAGRLETRQTSLSRVFQQLIDAAVLDREIPFGESARTTKKTSYRIVDPALKFWFGVYSPHRSRWRHASREERLRWIHGHASVIFEEYLRSLIPGAKRYWERTTEFDIVGPDPLDPEGLLVAEVKWKRLKSKSREEVLRELQLKWESCAISRKSQRVRFAVLDATELERLSGGA